MRFKHDDSINSIIVAVSVIVIDDSAILRCAE